MSRLAALLLLMVKNNVRIQNTDGVKCVLRMCGLRLTTVPTR